MSNVTRIIYSKNLNKEKYLQLVEIADRLGSLRKSIWNQFGSLSGIKNNHRKIRDEWLREEKKFDVPARLWKETLRDVMDDIRTYREAAKQKVRKSIWKRTKDKEERKRLFILLKYDRWHEDSFLRRKMRKFFKHGKTEVNNQIILDSCCYSSFLHNGKAWIKVMSLNNGKRISIPLNSRNLPQGTLRLVIRAIFCNMTYLLRKSVYVHTSTFIQIKMNFS